MTPQVDVSWPVDLLPLPSLDFSSAPRNATIVSPAENVAIVRRSRFERSYAVLTVGWKFKGAQIQIFKDFFYSDLGNGIAQFKIELRYPKASELTFWAVRFVGGYQTSPTCDHSHSDQSTHPLHRLPRYRQGDRSYLPSTKQ